MPSVRLGHHAQSIQSQTNSPCHNHSPTWAEPPGQDILWPQFSLCQSTSTLWQILGPRPIKIALTITKHHYYPPLRQIWYSMGAKSHPRWLHWALWHTTSQLCRTMSSINLVGTPSTFSTSIWIFQKESISIYPQATTWPLSNSKMAFSQQQNFTSMQTDTVSLLFLLQPLPRYPQACL